MAKPTRAKGLGITDDGYAAMLAEQGGGCAICGSTPKTRRLHVDHDHASGRVRGLLCRGDVVTAPRVFGNGGPNGARVLWPAGLEALTPAERVAALARGYWPDGDHIITRDGRRLYRPVEARRLRAGVTP